MSLKPETRFWIGIYGFAAFIMVVAVGVFSWLAWESHQEVEAGGGITAKSRPTPVTSPVPIETLELLAAFQAPGYTRSPSDPAAFAKAMQGYARRDYAGAIPGLRAVSQAQPEFTAARFYLGICLLLTQDRISGIQELRAAAEAGGTYLERARFYLAKGLLAEGDVKRAQEQLESVVAQHGELEKQARGLLAQVRSAP